MYETVRALRHDLKNHLLCISSMANEKDIQGIQQYTQQLLQQQNAVSKLITFSGNTALDAIVNSKSTTAEHVGVQLRAIITTPLSDISPEDITIILGNALDNAIRAAKDSIEKQLTSTFNHKVHTILLSLSMILRVLSYPIILH